MTSQIIAKTKGSIGADEHRAESMPSDGIYDVESNHCQQQQAQHDAGGRTHEPANAREGRLHALVSPPFEILAHLRCARLRAPRRMTHHGRPSSFEGRASVATSG